MRPHDIVVLLKNTSLNEGGIEKKEITNKALAESLKISPAEINRSAIAELLEPPNKRVNRPRR